jgi:hypothetical protein
MVQAIIRALLLHPARDSSKRSPYQHPTTTAGCSADGGQLEEHSGANHRIHERADNQTRGSVDVRRLRTNTV